MPDPHGKSKSDPSWTPVLKLQLALLPALLPAVNLWAFGFCKKIFCAPFELKIFEDDFFFAFEGNRALEFHKTNCILIK